MGWFISASHVTPDALPFVVHIDSAEQLTQRFMAFLRYREQSSLLSPAQKVHVVQFEILSRKRESGLVTVVAKCIAGAREIGRKEGSQVNIKAGYHVFVLKGVMSIDAHTQGNMKVKRYLQCGRNPIKKLWT